MGFTKLDEKILFSSIMRESSDTFKIWIALLASCKSDGIARISSAALPGICHLSQGVVDEALRILKAPDPRSRSKKEKGRRIVEVDGGFRIVNYAKYRAFFHQKEYEAERKRKYREGKRNVPVSQNCPGLVPDSYASASASASEEEDKRRSTIDRVCPTTPVPPARW